MDFLHANEKFIFWSVAALIITGLLFIAANGIDGVGFNLAAAAGAQVISVFGW